MSIGSLIMKHRRGWIIGRGRTSLLYSTVQVRKWLHYLDHDRKYDAAIRLEGGADSACEVIELDPSLVALRNGTYEKGWSI